MMGNDAIKDAIKKHLEKNNIIKEDGYPILLNESKKSKVFRDKVDEELLNLKIKIINSNFHLLLDKIFKEDKEGVLAIVKNTKDRTIFFDVTEAFGKFLISFEQYTQNYEFECPDLEDIKETFALKDNQLYELIEEIYLDNK